MRQIWLITFCTLLKFAFCEITCNDSKGSCECLSSRIQCPTETDDIIIDINGGIIEMECPLELKHFHFEKPPDVTIDTDISKFIMRYCPLPPNNFKEIFDWFSVQNVVTFEFYAWELNDSVLRKKYFQSFENLKHLALSDNGIKEFEENFFTNLTQLKLLDLKQNSINLTTSTFKNLQFLEYLDLSSNNLKFVPRGVFQSVKTLTTLYLSDNRLTKIDDFTFAGLSNLHLLELSINKIGTISESAFASLKNLTRLNLSNNSLKTLPGGLFQGNKNLKQVRIKHNFGLRLPELVFANLFLTEVDLEKCRLGEIPENVFENTTTLKVIELGENDLEHLSERVFKGLANLEKISLQQNKIKSISHLFKGLERITVLQLRNNLIEEIGGEAFADLINLEKIVLKGNRIKQIHSLVFSKNHKLKNVDLSDNEIVDNFEEAITSTQSNSLIHWNLRRNCIQQIKLENWTNVSIILDYNSITVMDPNYIKPNSTLKISINNNPIICNCLNYNLLDHIRNQSRSNLTITAKNVKCLGPQDFENLELSSLTCSLEEISKNNTKCPKNCSCIWRPFDASVVVNCSNKSLVKYPQVDLSQFKTYVYNEIELHLENNKLEIGPEDHFGYLNITKLFLSNNTIKTIDWVPPKLKLLYLDQNRINKIPLKVIDTLKKTALVNLTLNDNPWTCVCGAEILAQFLRTVPNLSTNIYCANTTLRLIDMKKEDFCKSQAVLYLTTLILSLLFISALLAIFYYRNQETINFWLLSHNLCWLSEENLDKDKIYDVFISYSHQDEPFAQALLSFLETGPNPFKVCVHYRDWIPGEPITTQIINSVVKSRRTLVVLSRNFLKSVWGTMEFKTAHMQALSDGRNRVVVVWYGDVEVEKLDEELKVYLRTNTFVKWGDEFFWEKLKKALPRATKCESKSGVQEDEDMLIQSL